tara:strand:- start:1911 stop:2573 length:663 start_codon:yes stop_codon:yes gene_type:complete
MERYSNTLRAYNGRRWGDKMEAQRNLDTTRLTEMYRLRYKEPSEKQLGGPFGNNRTHARTIEEDVMSNTNIRFELARIEAKIDILTGLVLKSENASSGSQPYSDATQAAITASEQALMRSMTTKQHVTAQLLVDGWSNKEIAGVINIGENTVKLHVRAVCKKVGTKTRGQAAMIISDIMERMEPSEYKRTSGGLPSDWGRTLNVDVEDHYAALYRSKVNE